LASSSAMGPLPQMSFVCIRLRGWRNSKPPSESNRLRALQSRVLACATGIRTSSARALPTTLLRRDRSAARPRASKAGHASCCSTRSGYSVAPAHCARCSSAKLRALRARGLRWSWVTNPARCVSPSSSIRRSHSARYNQF